jgi:hypothetical protein
MSWELVGAWVVIVLVVLASWRMNDADEDMPPPEDDG